MENLYEKTRAEEIGEVISGFCEKYLDEALNGFALALLTCVQKNRRINIFHGKKEQWAAAIVYVIARLNFLFDKENKHHITPAMLCDYFSVQKEQTVNKAEQIIKKCGILLADKKYTGKEIISLFKFYKTKVGFVVPKSSLDYRIKNIEMLDKEEAEKLRRCVQERRKTEEQKLREKLIRKAEKNKQRHKGQIDLFTW